MPKVITVIKNIRLETVGSVALFSFLHCLISLSTFSSRTIFSLLFILLSLTFLFATFFIHISFDPFTLPQVLQGKRSKSSFIYNNGVVSYQSILSPRQNAFRRWWYMSSWLEATMVTSLTILMVPSGMEVQSGKL